MVDSVKQTDSQQTLNITGSAVALILATSLAYSIYIVMHSELPDKNQNIIVFLLGFLTAKLSTIIDFFFGTSSGNKAKDATIQTLSDTAASVQATLTPQITTTTVTSTTPPTNATVATVATPTTVIPLHADEKATVTTVPNTPPPAQPPKPPGT